MSSTLPLVVGVVGGVVGLLSFLWTLLRAKSGDTRQAVELLVTAAVAAAMASVAASQALIAERLTVVEVKSGLYWDSVAKAAATLLHSPHPEHKRRDELLERYATLGLAERAELARLLEAMVADHEVPSGERVAAGQLLAYLSIATM